MKKVKENQKRFITVNVYRAAPESIWLARMPCPTRQRVHVFHSTRYIVHAESSPNSAAYYPAHALRTVLPDVMTQRNSTVHDVEHINHKGASHSVGAYLRQSACLCAW